MSLALSATASDALLHHRRMMTRRVALSAALGVAMVLAFLADVATGPAALPVLEVIGGLFSPSSLDLADRVILWDIRLPQAVMALLVGAALALAGVEMQTVLDNPMASPFTLGVSSAAALGAALAIVVGWGIPGVPQSVILSANAFVLALLAVGMLQAVGRVQGSSPAVLVLFGIGLNFAFNAGIAILQFAASQESLQQLVFWTMGSLARATWEKIAILLVVVGGLMPWALRSSWKLTALRLGEDRARSFGVDVVALRFSALLRISLLAASAVAFAGTIGFVGLLGPHIARMMIGEDHRFLLPASALVGALTLSLASIASKTLLPGVVLPIGIVTALIGLPIFFWLVFRRRSAG